jgi:hypothetical protein
MGPSREIIKSQSSTNGNHHESLICKADTLNTKINPFKEFRECFDVPSKQ